jgi:hypothetical protein
MNYLHKYPTHVSPRRPELSKTHLTNNPRLNEIIIDHLVFGTRWEAFRRDVVRKFRKKCLEVLEMLMAAFIASCMALFILAFWIWA